MRIYRHRSELPRTSTQAVATIGNFDGVHCGHQWVIQRVIERAHARNAKSIVVTFDPHPARALRPGETRRMITPLETKLELLSATGLDEALVLPFDEELARMSARSFAYDVLHTDLNVSELHEGENFRFGYGAEGDIEVLECLGQELGFTVQQYAPRSMLGAPISSSRIRNMISVGDVHLTRKLLGRPFSIESTPASGRGFGTRYTVPTINLAPYAELLPGNGVYITSLAVGKGASREVFDGVTNVGNRPTFGADSFAVESYLLNFHSIELSEETPIMLTFLKRLRPEVQWPNPEALRTQIGRDVARTKEYFRLMHRVRSRQVSTDPAV